MTGPVVIDSAEWAEILQALFWVAFVGGIAGSVFMSLCSEVYRWIERRIERRQREREFREDMQCIVGELEGRPAPMPPLAPRIPFGTKIVLGVMPAVLALSVYLWAVARG